MKQYEYDLVIVEVNHKYIEYLNSRGLGGWQVVAQQTMSGGTYAITFMREMTELEVLPPINLIKHDHSLIFPCTKSCPQRGTQHEIPL